ncbi:hypothetical protein Q0590_12780 [Rhodocytophaga aerolata]|uniref:Uncharacterized protein n=1 Tax=Rhodocytophaga aerolata TaxID=455078 RepID=A0ABT8R4V3_9BACT|nr:hypothetical protein [Rhodocytophaga aerolata]MDO1447136.1 hypothetical protein [Rhodocytophaga aerolata]
MKASLFSRQVKLGVFSLNLIDESMGIVGGTIYPTEEYFKNYQQIFRKHLEKPNFDKISKLQLKVVTQDGEELKPMGGIVVTDIKKYADHITVEVCGVDSMVMKKIR